MLVFISKLIKDLPPNCHVIMLLVRVLLRVWPTWNGSGHSNYIYYPTLIFRTYTIYVRHDVGHLIMVHEYDIVLPFGVKCEIVCTLHKESFFGFSFH